MTQISGSSVVALLLVALAACENPDPIGLVLADAGIDARHGECAAELIACGVSELGWNAWCQDSVVVLDDLTTSYFCEVGSDTPVCQTGGNGDAIIVGTCLAGCRDDDVHYYETPEEYSDFEPRDLCAVGFPDGGVVDAAMPIPIPPDADVLADAGFAE